MGAASIVSNFYNGIVNSWINVYGSPIFCNYVQVDYSTHVGLYALPTASSMYASFANVLYASGNSGINANEMSRTYAQDSYVGNCATLCYGANAISSVVASLPNVGSGTAMQTFGTTGTTYSPAINTSTNGCYIQQ